MVGSFLYALAGGMLIIVSTARVQLIDWNFLRLVGFMAFGIVCLVAFWSVARGSGSEGPALAWSLRLGIMAATAAFALVFTASLAGTQPGVVRIICLMGGLCGLAAACLTVTVHLYDNAASNLAIGLTLVGHVLGGLLLGSITIAWLLGHAYLTATKMTIAPLLYFSRLLMWLVGVRFLFFVGVVGLPLLFGSTGGAPPLDALLGSWILLVIRVGMGLMAVGVFAYMVVDCVRIRATQSATGILYFGSVLAYVGELTALNLSMRFAWPL